jgi:hypothetical protein
MIREVILEVAGEVSDTATGGAQDSRDPNSSPYPWGGSPTKTLAEAWSGDDNDSYWYMWPHKDNGGVGTILASFAAPPTLAIFRAVKLQAWWSYSQSGPNNWYFPPDNAFGPRARLAIRNRAKSGNLYGSYREILWPADEGYDENINTHLGYVGPLLQEWETTAHPEGGPWTIDDLSVANFAAGIELEASAPAYLNEQGSFFKIRVHKLRVLLTVEDLGGYVDNIRHASTLTLRLMRRARNTIALRSFADRTVGEVGSRVYLSHPRGPSVAADGWGARRLERRAGMILKRTISPETFRVEDQVFDLQAYRCLLWAAYRIDCPWSPELQGLAFLDKGGGYMHTRAQDAWSPRSGDGVLMRVLEDYPNLFFHGLAAQGGGDVAICLRNYDLMQAGWSTVGNSGVFSVAASTTVGMVEEQGYISSALLTYGAGGGAGGRERSLGALGAGLLHLRVVIRNTSVPDPETQFGEWYLKRGTDYWDEANRTWSGSAVYNPISSNEPCGEAVADAIPCTATSYAIGVGRFSSQMGPVVLNGAVVDVQHSDETVGGARTPLVMLDATITREPDVHRLPNSLAAELWSYERGVAVVEVQPFWRAEALPDDEVKPLLHAYHAEGTWDALQFVAQTDSDDLVRFERGVLGQATFQLDCPIPGLDLNRTHVLRAWARWLGADGWTEYGPYSLEVGYAVFLESDGSLVSSDSVLGRFAYEGAVAARDWLGIGNDETRHAEAYVRMLEIRRNPIHQLEATWRV